MSEPKTAEVKSGDLHTLMMKLIREDIQRQHPEAFTEDNDFDLIIQSGPERPSYVKIDTSALAEAVLPHVQSARRPIGEYAGMTSQVEHAFDALEKFRDYGYARWSVGAAIDVIRSAIVAASPPAETGEGWRFITSEPRVNEIGHLWLAADADGKCFPGIYVGHRIPAGTIKVFHIPDPNAAAQPVSPSEGEAVALAGTHAGQAHRYAESLRRSLAGFERGQPWGCDPYAVWFAIGALVALYTHPASDQSDTERMREAQIAWRGGEPPKDGTVFYGHHWTPHRWLPYSPKSEQAKRGVKGRWQAMNEFGGWDNASAPNEWATEEAVSARAAALAEKAAGK